MSATCHSKISDEVLSDGLVYEYHKPEAMAMSRQSAEIRTESYIHVGGTLVLVDALQEEQRAQVATELSRMMLTAAFCGRAVFTLQSPTEKGLSLP